jgi:hypothetical protein
LVLGTLEAFKKIGGTPNWLKQQFGGTLCNKTSKKDNNFKFGGTPDTS